MKVSLNGLLLRLKGRPDQVYTIKELLNNYKLAKQAFFNGDTKTVEEFFNIYIIEEKQGD